MSRAHANKGKQWELRLEGWHRAYRAHGVYVVRTPPPVKVLGRIERGTFRACFESGGPPDYMGAINGRAIVFDAKSTSSARWSYSSLEVHQARSFDAALEAGVYVFIALRLPSAELVVPWALLGPTWWAWHRAKSTGKRAKAGEASLALEDAALWCHRMDARGWLGVVRALIEEDTPAAECREGG